MSDVVDLTEDDDFLSMVEAAEAKAKRQKLSAAAENSEGSYMAALRGSRSLQWQQQQMKRNSFDSSSKSKSNPSGRFAAPTSASAADSSLSTPAAGACFKCGKSGHWARECAGSSGAGGDGGQGNQTVIAEKPCPCGFGACLVLTANTEKNRGRKFYRCPVREENGGCSFFEWCDNTSGDASSMGGLTNSSSSSVPDLPCPCGAGTCLVLTAKTEKNMGQQFYRCPANQEASCGFFKWCSDRSSPVARLPASYSQSYDTWNDKSSQQLGGRSGSSCFKCGQEGHWARDCFNKSSDDAADIGGKPASSNVCYKCGKTGHWARDCSVDDTKTRSRKAAASFRGK